MIETARLRLRPWRNEDLDPLTAIYADPDVMRYIGPGTIRNRVQTIQAMLRMRSNWVKQGFGMWALEVADSGEMIGRQGLGYLDNTDEVEIGYCLARDAWGHGYATESAQAAVRFAFDVVGLDHLAGITFPENVASQGVLRKCGLRSIGKRLYYDVDVHYFRITKEQWQARVGVA